MRHDDMIAARLIIGLRTMMAHRDWHLAKKRIKLGVPIIGIGGGDDRRGVGYCFSMPSICSALKTV
jgi:hypothetical protein